MASRAFWDTSGFYAVLSSDDRHHQRAIKLVDKFRSGLVQTLTTDWVIGETVNLLIVRRKAHLVPGFLEIVNSSRSLAISFVGPERFIASQKFLIKHLDQGYSLTDCSSFVVMQELKLKEAVTSDRHFQRAGFKALLALSSA